MQVLYEASSIDGINASLLDDYWSWGDGAERFGRVQGKFKKFVCKKRGLVSIKWPDATTCKTERLFVLDADEKTYMLQPEFDMQLEDFDGGTAAPIPVGIYDTFHLARANLRDVKVLTARAK